jgi:hypothetical protein
MKTVLLLTISLLLVASVAMADNIGVYSDETGSSCDLAPGFSNNAATLIHQYSAGATGSHFKVKFPAGSSFFAFNSPIVSVGNLNTGVSLSYGECLNTPIVLGTITAILAVGTVEVLPADGFAHVYVTDCSLTERPSTASKAYVGVTGDCGILAAESATWGKVKALYR